MSVSQISSYDIETEESDENFPQIHDIEDRYVRQKCSHHHSYDRKSVRISDPEINPEITEEIAEEDIGPEDVINEGGLNETLGASDFTDAECGEPMQSQFLSLDFTPITGIDDNPHLEKKCSDFWQFICSHPQLQGLMAFPESGGYEEILAASSSETSLQKCINFPTPAVEWLEAGVDQKVAFATEHQTKYCHHQDSSYIDVALPSKKREDAQLKSVERGIFQTSSYLNLHERPTTKKKNHLFSTSNAENLCMQLDKWDHQHPKSMDPPGRVPNLTHAILQRKEQER